MAAAAPVAEYQHRQEDAEQAENAVNRLEIPEAAVRDELRHGQQQGGDREEVLRPFAGMQPIDAMPGADPGLDVGDDAADAGRQQQAQVAGVGEEQGHGRPWQQGLVGRRDVEDLAEHGDIQHEAGKGDQRRQLGEVAGSIAPLQPEGECEGAQGAADQDCHLGGFGEETPELVEQEEDAGGQRQRAEEGSDAHAERKLLGPRVTVDIEKSGKFGEQPFVMRRHALPLGAAQLQRAFALQALQFVAKTVDIVSPLLGFAARDAGPGHDELPFSARR